MEAAWGALREPTYLWQPSVFQAVASQEPAIEPALAYDDITLRDKIGRPDGARLQDRILLKRIYGDPIDKDY
jgi:hypothetical protein